MIINSTTATGTATPTIIHRLFCDSGGDSLTWSTAIKEIREKLEFMYQILAVFNHSVKALTSKIYFLDMNI